MKRKISIKGSSFFSKKKLPGGNSRTEYRPGKGKGFRIMSSDDTLPQNNINYNPYESLNSDYGSTFIDYEGAVESIKEDETRKSTIKHLYYAKKVNDEKSYWEITFDFIKLNYNNLEFELLILILICLFIDLEMLMQRVILILRLIIGA